MMAGDDENIGLSEHEIMTIIEGFLRQRGSRGATEAEMKAVVDRVSQMHLDGLMAELICTGRIDVSDWDAEANDIVMKAPAAKE